MKNLLLLLSILTISFGAYAQIDNPVVFSLEGNARFKTPDAEKAVKLKTGDQLDQTGRIIIKENAQVGIIFDEQYIFLKEPGRYKVEDLIAPGKLEESEAAELLNLQLPGALDPYFRTVKLQRAGFAETTTNTKTPPPKKRSRTGHGNKENALVRLMPIGGKVTGPAVQFAWVIQDSTLNAKAFDLIIMDREEVVRLKQTVKGRKATIDFSTLGIEPGSNFKWRVEAKEDANKNTGDIAVQYAPTSASTNALEFIQEDPAYKMASPAAKMLMEATAYENANLLAKAGETYKAIRKDFKKDRLGKLMYFAFLWRHDLVK